MLKVHGLRSKYSIVFYPDISATLASDVLEYAGALGLTPKLIKSLRDIPSTHNIESGFDNVFTFAVVKFVSGVVL